jgi:hypothetical protein
MGSLGRADADGVCARPDPDQAADLPFPVL